MRDARDIRSITTGMTVLLRVVRTNIGYLMMTDIPRDRVGPIYMTILYAGDGSSGVQRRCGRGRRMPLNPTLRDDLDLVTLSGCGMRRLCGLPTTDDRLRSGLNRCLLSSRGVGYDDVQSSVITPSTVM